jgi:hypothetical protein
LSNVFHNLLRAADHGFWLVDPPFMIANRNYDETPPNSAPIEAKNSPLDATCFEFHFDEAIAIFDMLPIAQAGQKQHHGHLGQMDYLYTSQSIGSPVGDLHSIDTSSFPSQICDKRFKSALHLD